jgi:hypothetical protein
MKGKPRTMRIGLAGISSKLNSNSAERISIVIKGCNNFIFTGIPLKL